MVRQTMGDSIKSMHIYRILLHDLFALHNSVCIRSSTSSYSLDRYTYCNLDHFVYVPRHWNRYSSKKSITIYRLPKLLMFVLMSMQNINYILFHFSNFSLEIRGRKTDSRPSIPKTLPHILAYVQFVCRLLLPHRITIKAFGNPD